MKADETIDVSAQWEPSGRFTPNQFIWQGQRYIVESTGRRWEDEHGLHVLCMVPGGQVFELIFQLNPAGWRLRTPAAPTRMA